MKTGRIAALLGIAMSLPGWGSSQPSSQGHYEITAQQVAQSFSNRGVQTADLQVTLLAKVVAAESNPELVVLSIEPRGSSRPAGRSETSFMVKLGCHAESVCLPFYAMVKQRDAASEFSSASTLVAARSKGQLKPDDAVAIRSGAHAVLLMDDGDTQIEVAVVSLENGVAGHKIHVTSLDHKQVYLAKVVSATLLTRSF